MIGVVYEGEVRRITYRVFEVQSESDPEVFYRVWWDPVRNEWRCTCPASFYMRKGRCKHVMKVLEIVGGETIE